MENPSANEKKKEETRKSKLQTSRFHCACLCREGGARVDVALVFVAAKPGCLQLWPESLLGSHSPTEV